MVEMTWKKGHMLNTLNVWQIILVDWIVIKRSSTSLPLLLLMFFHCWFHWDFCFHVSSAHVLHPHLYNYYYISHSYPSAIYMSNPYLYTPIVWHMYPNYALKGILWANLPIMKAHHPPNLWGLLWVHQVLAKNKTLQCIASSLKYVRCSGSGSHARCLSSFVLCLLIQYVSSSKVTRINSSRSDTCMFDL
jgi:hypothetical protein